MEDIGAHAQSSNQHMLAIAPVVNATVVLRVLVTSRSSIHSSVHMQGMQVVTNLTIMPVAHMTAVIAVKTHA